MQLSEESKVSFGNISTCWPDVDTLQERVAKLIDLSRVAIH
jgi:hypothetical protein